MGKILDIFRNSLLMGLVYASIALAASDLSGLYEYRCAPEDSGPSSQMILDSFSEGLIAYNAIQGTAETIHTSDRKVLVCRNSYSGPGYNQASAKRQLSAASKWMFRSMSCQYIPSRHLSIVYNADILDKGMSANSERIHFLRILIV